MKRLLPLLVLGLVIALGIRQALETHDSRQWPSTDGVIDESRIVRETLRRTEKGEHPPRYRYEVRVRYSYRVDGVAHDGRRLRIGAQKYAAEQDAQRELARYPVGQPVRVHYDPQAPERSVLQLR